MELLVVLVISSMLMGVLFQSLGILRRAQERVDASGLRARREALVAHWYLASVSGLYAAEKYQFSGAADHWRGLTMQPLQGRPGAPAEITWTLSGSAQSPILEYRGGEGVVQSFPLPPGRWAFQFQDMSGKFHESWPPALGLATAIPAAVSLTDIDGGALRWYAAVAGPLKPFEQPFEPEE